MLVYRDKSSGVRYRSQSEAVFDTTRSEIARRSRTSQPRRTKLLSYNVIRLTKLPGLARQVVSHHWSAIRFRSAIMFRLYHARATCQGLSRRSMPVRSRIRLEISSIEHSVASMTGMPFLSNSDSAARTSKATWREDE